MRNYGIDLLRMICIFAVIVIHASFGDQEGRDFILRGLPYANACFAFLAGWYMQNEEYGWMKKRARRLLIPYVIWTLFSMLLHAAEAVRVGNVVISSPLQLTRDIFFGTASVQLWFVISLFYFQMILGGVAFCVEKLHAKNYFLVVVVGLFTMSVWLYFRVPEVVRYILFFGVYTSLGVICKAMISVMGIAGCLKKRELLCRISFFVAIIILIFSVNDVLRWRPSCLKMIDVDVFIWCATFGIGGMCINNQRLKNSFLHIVLDSTAKCVMGVYLVHWLVLRSIFKPLLPYTSELIGFDCGVILFNSIATFVISCFIVYSTRKWEYIWG